MESLTPDYIQGHDVPESVYRASPEWAASDLKYGIDNGLEALHQRKFGKDNPPRIATPAMKFGSMIHKFILEHSDFNKSYGLLDDKRSKVGKAKALVMQEQGVDGAMGESLEGSYPICGGCSVQRSFLDVGVRLSRVSRSHHADALGATQLRPWRWRAEPCG